MTQKVAKTPVKEMLKNKEHFYNYAMRTRAGLQNIR